MTETTTAPTVEEVTETLLAQTWNFAKTRPKNPHFWSLKKEWQGPVSFTETVKFLRDNGYEMRFGRRVYLCFDVGEFRYWDMGEETLDNVRLINRAKNLNGGQGRG